MGAPEPGAGGAWLVTRAAPGEAPALAALGAGALAHGWSAEALAGELARPDARVYALRGLPGGPPAGFLLARHGPGELHVLLMAVAPARRRCGGGGALLEAALADARAAGLAAAHLEVRAGNRAALALYARHGFLAVGRRPRYYEGREDAILMSRRLEEEPALTAARPLAIRADAEVRANGPEGAARAGGGRRLVLGVAGWPGSAPGQFAMLSPGATGAAPRFDPLLPRPMAVYRAAPEPGGAEVEILYKVGGRGTRLLADARPGERVRLVGPLGSGFALPAAGQRALLVGGGTGIASLHGLARAARARGPVAVLLGARHEGELLGRADFAALGVDLRIATEDGSAGRRGLVTALLEEALAEPGAGGEQVYACGPTPMMRAAAAIAAAHGRRCVVSLENTMACGFGVCLGCAVPRAGGGFALVCRDGPVLDAAAVAWEALP